MESAPYLAMRGRPLDVRRPRMAALSALKTGPYLHAYPYKSTISPILFPRESSWGGPYAAQLRLTKAVGQ